MSIDYTDFRLVIHCPNHPDNTLEISLIDAVKTYHRDELFDIDDFHDLIGEKADPESGCTGGKLLLGAMGEFADILTKNIDTHDLDQALDFMEESHQADTLDLECGAWLAYLNEHNGCYGTGDAKRAYNAFVSRFDSIGHFVDETLDQFIYDNIPDANISTLFRDILESAMNEETAKHIFEHADYFRYSYWYEPADNGDIYVFNE